MPNNAAVNYLEKARAQFLKASASDWQPAMDSLMAHFRFAFLLVEPSSELHSLSEKAHDAAVAFVQELAATPSDTKETDRLGALFETSMENLIAATRRATPSQAARDMSMP
jgi:hypothetical protein